MNIFPFLFFIFKVIISSEPLTFSFTTRKKKGDNFMETLINNDIYTSFLVGSNKQLIEFNIKSQQSSTFLLSESCSQNTKAKKFIENESSSYTVKLAKARYYMYEFKEATYSSDNIILLQNNNKQIEVDNYNFMLANTLWDDYQEYMGGMIGLKFQNKVEGKLTEPERTYFIEQLKEKNKINSYVFVLDYKDEYNGIFYVGEYFHDFNKNYSSNDFISAKAGNEKFKFKDWDLNIEKVISGNTIEQNNTYLQLFYELGIIAAPESYRAYINNTFFKSYYKDGICKEMLNLEKIASFKKYNYIVCDKNKFKKESFPKLIFYNRDMNLNLTMDYNNLFVENENKIYFLIIFPIYGIDVEYWLMGKPFIKKYKLFLDNDKKSIGLYLNYKEIKKEEEEEEKNNNKNSNVYIVIIIILVVVLIASLISIFYYFLVIKKARRIRANELDDNIDYTPYNNDKEKEKENKFIIN